MTDEASPPNEDPRVLELERRLADLEATTAARLLQSELKAHATKAGMIDLDGLKLVETSGLKLNEKGEVDGATRLMADLRRAKPWLFQGASSSSAAVVPPASQPSAKRATEMSHAEWQAARNELLKRR